VNIVPLATPETAADPFDDFWTLYPRRIAKKDAREMWRRIPAAKHLTILTALVEWRKVWAGKELEFLPHPATWLNGERWEDEIPVSPTVSAAAHLPAKLPAQGERTEMPPQVRAALAKLRGAA
jgi:hypothetical protein